MKKLDIGKPSTKLNIIVAILAPHFCLQMFCTSLHIVQKGTTVEATEHVTFAFLRENKSDKAAEIYEVQSHLSATTGTGLV